MCIHFELNAIKHGYWNAKKRGNFHHMDLIEFWNTLCRPQHKYVYHHTAVQRYYYALIYCSIVLRSGSM